MMCLAVTLNLNNFFMISIVSKTFYDLSTVEDIKQWMSEIYLDGLIRNVTHDLTDNDTIILHINEQNKIISNAVARVTYRTMKLNQIQSFENPDYNVENFIRKSS